MIVLQIAQAPVLVVPMPAQILQMASLPQALPLPVALEAPAAVPEPGTLATLAAGQVLMGVLACRRRAAHLSFREPVTPSLRLCATPARGRCCRRRTR
jgi:hypothetical protein